MKISFLKHLVLALCVSLFIISCEKEEDNTYDVPTTYAFTNDNGNSTVDYLGQTQRLDMVVELITYLKTASTTGVTLDAQKIKDMYRNENNRFTGAGLNASGRQIKDKVFAPDQALFESYFDSIAAASQSTQPASNGVAGVSVAGNGTSKYLLAANGFEYAQMIDKGLMGALMYYQATGVYLESEKMGVDNTNALDATNGKHYTQMEHHWDEAFGYFGVPTDFPTGTGARYWGKYSIERNAVLSTNQVMMDAFLRGRAAISNNDLTTRDAQIAIIRTQWERIAAGSAVHYMNGAKNDFSDDALRNHQLSEGYAFIRALKYSPVKSVTDEQISGWLELLGDNFYEVTPANITTVRDEIAEAFGLNSVKEQL